MLVFFLPFLHQLASSFCINSVYQYDIIWLVICFRLWSPFWVFPKANFFLKILLVQLPALWLNTHILWGKKWLMSSKKLFEQTGSACNYVNWCSFVRFWWITIRSDTMVNTIFDGIWFWAVIETGDCSAQYTMALSRWPWDSF